MIILETGRLRLRAWIETDRELFAEINSDPAVMEFFPFRRTRAEADALFDRNNRNIRETGFGFFALAFRENDAPIGFCGLARTDLARRHRRDRLAPGSPPLGKGLRDGGSAGASRLWIQREEARGDRCHRRSGQHSLHRRDDADRHAS